MSSKDQKQDMDKCGELVDCCTSKLRWILLQPNTRTHGVHPGSSRSRRRSHKGAQKNGTKKTLSPLPPLLPTGQHYTSSNQKQPRFHNPKPKIRQRRRRSETTNAPITLTTMRKKDHTTNTLTVGIRQSLLHDNGRSKWNQLRNNSNREEIR